LSEIDLVDLVLLLLTFVEEINIREFQVWLSF